jgi:hypothetical protein
VVIVEHRAHYGMAVHIWRACLRLSGYDAVVLATNMTISGLFCVMYGGTGTSQLTARELFAI